MLQRFGGLGSKAAFFGPVAGFPFVLLLLLIAWALVWKGIALWRSARGGQKGWFVALLIINTVGILPIIYLAFFQKKGKASKK